MLRRFSKANAGRILAESGSFGHLSKEVRQRAAAEGQEPPGSGKEHELLFEEAARRCYIEWLLKDAERRLS